MMKKVYKGWKRKCEKNCRNCQWWKQEKRKKIDDEFERKYPSQGGTNVRNIMLQMTLKPLAYSIDSHFIPFDGHRFYDPCSECRKRKMKKSA